MNKEAYVHNEVILTCTNGFKTSKLLVKDRKVKIVKGKLIATEEDKPCNFTCKWAGVAAALVAAICIAAPFIVAILAAFIIGMGVALTVGSALCWILLKGSYWTEFHPRVKIGGQRALVEKSKLKCLVFGGDIKIFYNPATAMEELHNNRLRNTMEIFGAGFMGRGIRILGQSVKAIGYLGTVKATWMSIVKSVVYGYTIAEGANVITNATTGNDLSDGIGDSIPFLGGNDTIWDVAQSDYQKPFTEPLDFRAEAGISTDFRMQHQDVQEGLNQHSQNQINRYRQENPVHQYSRGKNSPHYGRQIKNQNRLNQRARAHGATQRSNLATRYRSRIRATFERNYTRINRGFLAFFALAEVFSQHSEKSLQNSLQNAAHPENQARSGTKVFAIKR